MNPLISVIIPTYKRPHYLRQLLNSLRDQSYENWECIVVDDGKNNDTEILVSSFAKTDNRFSYYKRPENHKKGGNGARNYGLSKSKGEWVQWFDDDDIMLKDYLLNRIVGIDQNTCLSYCTGFYTNQELNNRRLIEVFDSNNLYKDYAIWNLKLLTPSVLFKKSFLLEKNLVFNENILRGQETEFFCRALYNLDRLKSKFSSEGLFLYRQHSKTKTNSNHLSYRPNFTPSTIKIYIDNLKRAIELKDSELIRLFYSRCVALWFRCQRYKDQNHRNLLKSKFLKIIGENYPYLKWRIILVFYFSEITGTASTKLSSYLKLVINEYT
ncbi:hypothetical protein BST91_07975 [Nonlabens tegetincola]|uniref:glycosyltransferase family 2 protein n=1 Tax=Nonlabens tegetincola TaxID=323273 RepID=UPI000A20B863|nr:glycosyltransferase family 2 protein [Nonlabens tegetincola]ARN71582.1 hypothetical protein BST91_07975 [Nonlabens tegetincola]